eukprot:scaffold12614_cov66-Skeletonema_marinoi.AAC.1
MVDFPASTLPTTATRILRVERVSSTVLTQEVDAGELNFNRSRLLKVDASTAPLTPSANDDPRDNDDSDNGDGSNR